MLTSGVRRNPTINSFRSSFSSSFTWKVAPTATRQRRWDRNDSVSHLNKTTKMSLEGLERRRRRLQIAQIEGGGEGRTPDYDYGVVDLSLFLLLCLLSKGKKKERTINLRVVWWWYKNRKKKKRASSHSSKGKQWRWRRESSTAKLHTPTHQEQVGTHEHTAVKHKESLQLALKRSKLKWNERKFVALAEHVTICLFAPCRGWNCRLNFTRSLSSTCAHRSRQRNFPFFVSSRFLSFDLNLMASKVVWMCDTCAAVYLSNNQVTCIHISHTRTGETKLKKKQITLPLVDDVGGGGGGWCRPMTVLFPRLCIALPGRSIEFWRKNNKLFVPARAFAFPVHIGWFESKRIVHLRTWIYAQIS